MCVGYSHRWGVAPLSRRRGSSPLAANPARSSAGLGSGRLRHSRSWSATARAAGDAQEIPGSDGQDSGLAAIGGAVTPAGSRTAAETAGAISSRACARGGGVSAGRASTGRTPGVRSTASTPTAAGIRTAHAAVDTAGGTPRKRSTDAFPGLGPVAGDVPDASAGRNRKTDPLAIGRKGTSSVARDVPGTSTTHAQETDPPTDRQKAASPLAVGGAFAGVCDGLAGAAGRCPGGGGSAVRAASGSVPSPLSAAGPAGAPGARSRLGRRRVITRQP